MKIIVKTKAIPRLPTLEYPDMELGMYENQFIASSELYHVQYYLPVGGVGVISGRFVLDRYGLVNFWSIIERVVYDPSVFSNWYPSKILSPWEADE